MKRHVKVGALAGVLAVVATGCLVPYDFDANGKADVAYVQSDGSWFRVGEATPFFESADPSAFDVAVPGDYDGDGSWEAANLLDDGSWETAGTRGTFDFDHGPEDDILRNTWMPVPGNYSGDRSTEAAWYRFADATWMVQGSAAVNFGVGAGEDPAYFDVPVPADYDGDGTDELAVYRPSDGSFHVQGVGLVATVLPNGFPAPADYDGDGDDDPAVAGIVPVDLSSEDPDEWVWDPVFQIAGSDPTPFDDYAIPMPGNFNGGPGDEVAALRADLRSVMIEAQADVDLGDELASVVPTTLRPGLLGNFLRLTFLQKCARQGRVVFSPSPGSIQC